VLAVGQKKTGLEEENLIRSMAPLGGGIASSGGPCGALTGGVAFLGRLFGKATPDGKDDRRMWKAAAEFYHRFESEVVEQHASVNCSDIAKVDWRDREEVKKFYTGEGARECADTAGKAARILGEVIEKYTESGG
jgi:C_GCAxxG_C_C family probable redox protein